MPESELAGAVTALPGLQPSSTRRLLSVATAPDPVWDAGIVCIGTAQDVTADSGGQPGSLDTAAWTARLAADSTLRALLSAVPAAAELVGTRASSGFRRHLASLGDSLESIDMALLDELPTLSIVSGYAHVMESASPTVRISALLNACTGWAEGGTADRGSRTTGMALPSLPVAPSLRALLGSDQDRAPAPGMMRQRLLDVVTRESCYDVCEHFRDSYVDRDGAEFSLHEYVVRATVTGDGLVLRSLDVDARALPYPECPWQRDQRAP